jgi:hypothetical protein
MIFVCQEAGIMLVVLIIMYILAGMMGQYIKLEEQYLFLAIMMAIPLIITLATEMAAALNTIGRGGVFSCVYSMKTARLTVSNSTSSFKLLTDAELNVIAAQQTYNIANSVANPEWDVPQIYNLSKEGLKSVNYVSGILQSSATATIVVCEPINLNWLDTVYIHAGGLGAYHTLNLRGEKTIVKEIKVDGQPFSYIFDSASPFLDWLDCSHQTWSSLYFALRDKNGNDIDLNNRDLSFSIVLEDLTL